MSQGMRTAGGLGGWRARPDMGIRDPVAPLATLAKSAMPPEAEVNSEQQRQRQRLSSWRIDGAARDVIHSKKPELRIMCCERILYHAQLDQMVFQ
jgi:hypothetical protein